MDWALADSSDGVNGSPNTDDPRTKHFKRRGMEIVECSASELPDLSNDRENVAFRVTDTGVFDETVRSSRTNGFYTTHGNSIPLGSHFDGGADLFRFEDESEGSEVRNITVDASPDGRGVSLLNANRGCEMRNCSVNGEMDAATPWGSGIYVTVPRGEKVVLRNVNQKGGASRNYGVSSTEDSIGCLLNGTSNGVLETHDTTFGGFPNNGYYCEPYKHGNDGYAKIYNHTGYNSDRDQIRVGGRSKIVNPTLYVNRKKSGFDNLRGVWFKAAHGATLNGGSITTFSGSDTGSAIRVEDTSGAVDISGVDIELRGTDDRARGVLAFSPDNDNRNNSIVIEDTHIHGRGVTKDAILIKSGRPDSSIDATFDLPNVDESNYIDHR